MNVLLRSKRGAKRQLRGRRWAALPDSQVKSISTQCNLDCDYTVIWTVTTLLHEQCL